MAGRGAAWHGLAPAGQGRRGPVSPGMARRRRGRHGKDGKARSGKASRVRRGKARNGMAGHVMRTTWQAGP